MDRFSGLHISLGESITGPMLGLTPAKHGGHARSVSDSATLCSTIFVSKLPPAVANVPKEDIRGYMHTKRVQNYLVGNTLGEGSFAKVKEAFHILVGEKVRRRETQGVSVDYYCVHGSATWLTYHLASLLAP